LLLAYTPIQMSYRRDPTPEQDVLRRALRGRVMKLLEHELAVAGMTQADLAVKLNVGPPSVHRFLHARRNLTLDSLADIYGAMGAEIIGFTVEYRRRGR
jgi:transcriptional regulator with XRE-family HTH domain